MIQVVMFDLGGTLERNREPLPHALESVETIAGFAAEDGTRIAHCLVSDFTLANPFETERVASIFEDYLRIVEALNLREAFEPVGQRVTLSTHANAFKPDRSVFDLALTRLGVSAPFSECLFITENVEHIDATRALGMDCLQFGADGPDGFDNWAEGVVKVALKVGPNNTDNINAALAVLGDENGFSDTRTLAVEGEIIHASAQVLVSLDDSKLGELDGLHVLMPALIELDLNRAGPKIDVRTNDDAKKEASAFVQSLKAHGKLGDGPMLLGQPTHEVISDDKGRRVLKRRGFD